MLGVAMAARNIFRYRRRSLITAGAIAFGVMLTVVMDGFLAGSETETIRNLRDYETGEVTIYPARYFPEREFLPFDRFIEGDGRAQAENALAGYAHTPRARLPGELYFNEDFFPIQGSAEAVITAVDPSTDGSVFRTAAMVTEGRWLTPGDTAIVLGSWLAEDIGAKPGFVVSVECRGRGGFYQTFDAEIAGIVTTDDPYVNRSSVFMDLSYADDILELGGGVTEYTARIPGAPRTAAMAAKADAIGGRLPEGGPEAYGWQEVADSTLQLLRGESGESAIFLFFIFIIAAVGITNTMLMAVMERKHEIGMLRALGFSSFAVRRLFLLEGFGIGLIGTAAGLALGCAGNWFLVRYGIDFSFMLRDMDVGYRITGIMRSAWNVPGMLRTAAGALGVSTFVAWFPSGKILAREVADILRP